MTNGDNPPPIPAGDSNDQPFQFESTQKEVYDWLCKRIGQGPADFYLDACQLRSNNHLRSQSHLIAHCLREVEGSFLNLFEHLTSWPDDQEKCTNWEHIMRVRKTDASLGEKKKHFSSHYSAHPAHQETINDWTSIPKKYGALHKYAHKNDVNPTRKLDESTALMFSEYDQLFSGLIDIYNAQYFDSFSLVANNLTNGVRLAEYSSLLLHNYPLQKHFFELVEANSHYIDQVLPQLRNRHFLDHPPRLSQDEESGGQHATPWPILPFLVKIAPLYPDEAVSCIQTIPDTQNWIVEYDLLDAALALPPNRYPDIEERILKTIPILARITIGSSSYKDLVNYLVENGQFSGALRICEVLSEQILNDSESISDMRHEGKYDVQEFLKETRDSFLQNSPQEYLEHIFKTCLAYLTKFKNDIEVAFGLPSAIEDSRQDEHNHDPICNYIWELRRIGEHLLENGKPEVVQEFVARLLSEDKTIFKRLTLHLWRVGENALDLHSRDAFLSTRGVFGDLYLHHELYLLLESSFENFPDNIRESYNKYVDEPMDREKEKKNSNRDMSDEELDQIEMIRRYRKLYPIQSYLQGKYRDEFEKLEAKFGELDHPDFLVYHSGAHWVQPESILTLEEANGMTVPALRKSLSKYDWHKYEESSRDDPLDGTARILTSVTKERPEQLVEALKEFEGLQPSFLRGVLDGLKAAISEGQKFSDKDWLKIVEGCIWIVNQERNEEWRHDRYAEYDRGWAWTRKSVAQLLETILVKDSVGFPAELAGEIWHVFEILLEDEDAGKETYGSDIDGASGDAVNTVRGIAFHALIDYALWRHRRNLEKADGKDESKAPNSFDHMPEVREVLDKHLNIEHDPSYAVRSVYGQFFPWLQMLDPAWATQHAANVFPAGEQYRDYWYAAWSTYLRFCPAYGNVFDILHEQYKLAIDRMADDSDDDYDDQAEGRLAKHLAALYTLSKIDLDSEDGLIQAFYEKANDSDCRAFIVAFSEMLGDESDVDDFPYERSTTFWDRRYETIQNDPDAHGKELRAFGMLFTKTGFDAEWCLSRLQAVLEKANWVDSDTLVVERLSELVEEYPIDCLQCLKLFLNKPPKKWSLMTIDKFARILLQKARGMDDQKVKDLAEEVINGFGENGFANYRDLL